MAGRTAKSTSFKEVLINNTDEYIDQALATDDPERRQKLREAIRQMQQLLLIVSELENK